ncbi:hypothetical protein [Salinicoccus sp. HZC-1]|uniref:hypothetical protein n=1 Tax=Salinicoccus sp. HZC-1 TaxID=3385497 RepID=UPI00398B99E3
MKMLSMAFLILFMSACAFNGIMPEHYDGQKVEKDREAITQFAENNRLTTEGLSERYPFIDSTEIIGSEPSTGSAGTLEPGTYPVGGEIEPGRYQVAVSEKVSASAVVVEDSAGNRIIELALGTRSPSTVLDLKAGYSFSFKTRTGEVHLEPQNHEPRQPADDGTLQIPPGIFEAGTHLEPGTYRLVTEVLPLLNENGEPEIYWNLNPAQPEMEVSSGETGEEMPPEGEAEVMVDIHENDMIVTEYPITLKRE